MGLLSLLAMIKGMIPVLEPIGEQGIGQIFDMIDAEVAKMQKSDLKDLALIMSPALKQFAIIEIQKLK